MTNRISSAGMHATVVGEMLKRQVALAKTQSQISSGQRIQTPADDPIATTRILSMEQRRGELEQYDKNSNILTARLNIGEQALADVGSLLQGVRERVIQANSGVLDQTARRSIAADIRARARDLLDIANRRDGTGEYLFAGYSTQIRPFSSGTSGVVYAGDQGVRSLQIGPDQHVADGFSGSDVFQRIAEGNGTFTTATGVHAGSGSIDTGTVTNPAAWVRDTYTVSFTTATTWEVRDSLANLVASGTYTAGEAIGFNGAEVVVGGDPAAGDSFTIAPASTENIFKTLEDLAQSLESTGTAAGTTASHRSLLSTAVAAGLTQLDQALDHVIDTRAVVGARLATIEDAESSRGLQNDELAASVSDLRDLDYAEAISRMNQQLLGLQAAQSAYTRIAQLSLFNYL
jgi:flagellar hook-associated protein 3 FlgL